jgi:hypothetical protein
MSKVNVALLYNGEFFARVSNFYAHHHARRSRLRIEALGELARTLVAGRSNVPPASIALESHYFKPTLPAIGAASHRRVLADRKFESLLDHLGVHLHPVPAGSSDLRAFPVSFALGALDVVRSGGFDVCVLVTGSSAHVPLVRVLRRDGISVLVIDWNLTWTVGGGQRCTRTAPALLHAADVAIPLGRILDDPACQADADAFFVSYSGPAGVPPSSGNVRRIGFRGPWESHTASGANAA